ncbi:MAG: hypothetical protein NZ899_01905 [Thermoguttaceae bacterium]|nr:hypothetical protein [Thermoguttaceae bacterium]
MYVLADRLREWPSENVPYVPVEPAEFEKVLSIINEQASPDRATSSSFIVSARYYARLVDASLVDGQALLDVRAGRGSSQELLARVFEPLSLPVGSLSWVERDGQPARWGISGSGKHKLVVDGSGTIMFPWAAGGIRREDGSVVFSLRLPAAQETRLIIDAPAQYVLMTNALSWAENVGDRPVRRWVVVLGGRTDCQLTFVPEPSTGQKPFVRWWHNYLVTATGVDATSRLEVGKPEGELRTLSVAVPPEFVVFDVTCDRPEKLQWEFYPSDKQGSVGRLELTFSPPLSDAGAEVVIRALAPLPQQGEWVILPWQCESGIWRQTTMEVVVKSPLRLGSCTVQGGYRIASGQSAEQAGELIRAVYERPDGQLVVQLFLPPSLYSVQGLTFLRLLGSEILAQSAVALKGIQGETWHVRTQLPAGWSVDSVESPEGAIRAWEIEGSDAKQSAGGRVLRIDFARPLSLSEPLVVVVACRRQLEASSLRLAAGQLLPLHWEDALTTENRMAIRMERPWQWNPPGVAELLTQPDDTLRKLAGAIQVPPDLPIWEIKSVPAAEIQMGVSVGYSGLAQTEVRFIGDHVQTAGSILCMPEPGGIVDQVRVVLVGQGGQDRRWVARRCEVRKAQDAEPVEVVPGEILPVRVDRETSSGRDTWVITFGIPIREPVLLEHEAELPWEEGLSLPLPWLPEGVEQHLALVAYATEHELLLEFAGENIRPAWRPLLRVVKTGSKIADGDSDKRAYWFRYWPPGSEGSSGSRHTSLLQVRKISPPQRTPWIWSAAYQTIIQPDKPVRHRSVLAVEAPTAGQLTCRWETPIRLVALIVDGKPRRFKGRGESPEDLAQISVAESSSVTRRESAIVGPAGSGGGEINSSDVNALSAGVGLSELVVPLDARDTPIIMEILWEDRECVSGWGMHLKPPRIVYNLPVLASSWTIWLPPGWEVERAGSFPAIRVETLLHRLFGRLARDKETPVFNPVSFVARGLGGWPVQDYSEALTKLGQFAELLMGSGGTAGPPGSGSESSQVSSSRPASTWGQLLARFVEGRVRTEGAGERRQTSPSPFAFVDDQAEAKANIWPVFVDAVALAAAGITPETSVAVPPVGGLEGFLDLLQQHGLSLIVHRRALLLTTGGEAAILASQFAHTGPKPPGLSRRPQLVPGFSRGAAGIFAMSGAVSGAQKDRGKGNPVDASSGKPTGGAAEFVKAAEPASLFPTPSSLLILQMADERFDRLVDDLLAGRASGGMRFLPVEQWIVSPFAGFWKKLKLAGSLAVQVPILGWSPDSVSADEISRSSLFVFRTAVHDAIRVTVAFVAMALVVSLGLHGVWTGFYWLAASVCLLVACVTAGPWAAGAGGWLIGQLLGLFIVAVWRKPPAAEYASAAAGSGGPKTLGGPPQGETCGQISADARDFSEGKTEALSTPPAEAIYLEDTGVCRVGQISKEGQSVDDVPSAPARVPSSPPAGTALSSPNLWMDMVSDSRGEEARRETALSGMLPPEPGRSEKTSVRRRGPLGHGFLRWFRLGTGCTFLAVVSSVGFGQATEAPRGAPASTYRVLIPVDAKGEPTGEKYQVPKPMWTELTRLVAEASDRWLISAARYRGRLVRMPEGGTWSLPEIRMVLQVDVLQLPAQLPLWLPPAQGIQPPTVYVNGRPAVMTVSELSGGPVVELPALGTNEVEAILTPQVWSEGQYTYASVPIPPVANSWLQVTSPPDAPSVEVVTSYGPIVKNPATGSVEALLGPVNELKLRWAAKEERPVDADLRLLMAVTADQDALTAEVAVRAADGGRLPQTVEFELDRDWQVATSLPAAIEPLTDTSSGGPIGYRWNLGEPLPPRGTARMRLVRRGSPVGHFYPNFFRVKKLRVSSLWMGFPASSTFQVQPLDATKVEPLTPSAFAEAWGENVPNLAAVWNIPLVKRDVGFLVRRPTGKLTGKQFLQVVIQPDTARLYYQLQVDLQNEEVFQHRLALPARFALESLELERQEGKQPLSGVRDNDGNLVVDLPTPLGAAHRIHLSGRCPLPREEGWSLPLIRALRQEVEPLRVDVWAPLSLSVTIKPAAVVQPQPLTPFVIPAEVRFLGAFELEPGQTEAARCAIRMERPSISGKQITRLQRTRDGWTTQVIWALNITGGAVSRLKVRLPKWAISSAVVDPAGELRAESVPAPGTGPPPSERKASGGSNGNDGHLGFTRPGQSSKRQDSNSTEAPRPADVFIPPDELVEASIEFERALTGLRTVRLSHIEVPGNRLLRIPPVELADGEITERYLVVPENMNLPFLDVPPDVLREVSLPEGIRDLVPSGAYRCYLVNGRLSRLTVLAVRGEPVVRLAVAYARLYRDGRFLGLVQWDIDPAGNRQLQVEVPPGLRILDWDLPGGYVVPPNEKGVWRVILPHPALPVVVSALLMGQAGSAESLWTGPRLRVPIPGIVGARQRETCWIVSFEGKADVVTAYPATQTDLSLAAQPMVAAALERFQSLAGLLRLASGELPALTEGDLAWIHAWEKSWLLAKQVFPSGGQRDGAIGGNMDPELANVFREVENLRVLWGASPEPPDVSPPGFLVESLSLLRADPGLSVTCWLDTSGGRELIVIWPVTWASQLGSMLLAVGAIIACLVPGVFGGVRAWLGSLLRRAPFAGLAVASLVWWLWFSPSALGFLLLLVAAGAGAIYRAYGFATFSDGR